MFSKRTSAWSICILVALYSACSATGATWYVDDDAVAGGDGTTWATAFTYIEDAIDTSSDGDTILVADGTYKGLKNKNITITSKAIILKGASADPQRCIIDCQGSGRWIYCYNLEDNGMVIEGFTILNGDISVQSESFSKGGAIRCFSSNPTISNCIISNCKAKLGGGLFLRYSNPKISNCVIEGNTANEGGGVYLRNSEPVLKNCFIPDNTAYEDGAAIYNKSSNPIITNCTIRNNSAWINGGSIYCDNYSTPVITNCILWGNTPEEVYASSATTVPAITWSNIQGGYDGTGNIDNDPVFLGSYNSQLRAGSPCIDTGTNQPAGELPEFDLKGFPRPIDGNEDGNAIADIGADEYDPVTPIIVVNTAEFIFSAAEETENPSPKTLAIQNTSGGVLNWQISGQTSWLSVSEASGTTTDEIDEISLIVDCSGLPRGAYTADLVIEDPQAFNSPVDISVSLFVSTTRYVPDEYSTIQEAINAAQPYDVIEIADGTYRGPGNKNLDYNGKPITARSASGDPRSCIINCEDEGQGFYFHNGESRFAVVEGITITRGYANYQNSTPTSFGGGIYCNEASPTITNCIFLENVSGNDGGGLCIRRANPIVSDCVFARNTCSQYGGGLCCDDDSAPEITNCQFVENISEGSGAGACFKSNYETRTTIRQCSFLRNTAGVSGGGILSLGCYLTVDSCEFRNNTAEDGGGFGNKGNTKIINCVFTENTAANGGGLWNRYARASVTNCTFRSNSATVGGGVYNQANTAGDAIITNCILWENAPEQVANDGNGINAIVHYCNIQGGHAGTGNINIDPLFMSFSSPRISLRSFCIDAGTNEPEGGLPSRGMDGNIRPLDGDEDGSEIADMGAFEADPTKPVILLSDDELAFHAFTGSDNPGDQMFTIRNGGVGTLNWQILEQIPWLEVSPSSGDSTGEQDAVIVSVDITNLKTGEYSAELVATDPAASNQVEIVTVSLLLTGPIFVPQEYPTIQAAIDAANNNDSIEIADGIYTGDGNKNLDLLEKTITVRSASGNPEGCIIDCEHDGRAFLIRNEEEVSAAIEGLTMKNGYVDNDSVYGQFGCGIYGRKTNLTINDCVFWNNHSDYVPSSGGGVYLSESQLSATNCRFIGNKAKQGGGCWCNNSVLSMKNTVFTSNTTIDSTSGNCQGGAICSRESEISLTNCSLNANEASDEGNALYLWNSNIEMSNSILWGQGPQIEHEYSTVEATWSNIRGGTGESWFGAGCIETDPLFVSPRGFVLFPNSPCVDAGTNEPADGLPTTDIFGSPRSIDGNGDSIPVSDMGAYEWVPGKPIIAIDKTVFSFEECFNSQPVPDQIITIRNPGAGTLNWAISGQPEWISVSPSSGSLAEEDEILVTLSLDITELPLGKHEAIFQLAAPGAINSPIYIELSLTIYPLILVPQDFPTIQQAIDAAQDYTIIEIEDGTYTGEGNKNLDFNGKNLTVRSKSGNPGLCIIDCENNGRGFYFHSEEDNSSLVKGMTITNGCTTSAPAGGGGISCDSASPTIRNCVICNNTTSYGNGGAAYLSASSARFINCIIHNNYIHYDIPSGGGIANYNSDSVFVNCLFVYNHAIDTPYWPELEESYGGAMYVSGVDAPYLQNCTFYANGAAFGGGIYSSNGSPTLVRNCIFISSSVSYSANSGMRITYSNVDGFVEGAGNITADPLFIDIDGPDDDILTWQDNNFSLMPASPCVDAGNNANILSDEDLLGNPRLADGNHDGLHDIDMGAFEYTPPACGNGSCETFEDHCSCPDDCGAPSLYEENCSDNIDDDCDGLIDMDDSDCVCGNEICSPNENQCSCPEDCGTPLNNEYECQDGIDNDCDGLTDSEDVDCAMPGDADLDGDVDLHDFAMFQECWGSTTYQCLSPFDVNVNGQLDYTDLAIFETLMSGPQDYE